MSEAIEQVRQRRGQLRERRQKASVPTVALVGYTNAGKTTLFNVLTRADAEASDALFVTLDPLIRQVRLPDNRELLVSDTVGFIDRLPHALVAAFRATLEEVAAADLILHVTDAAAPDRERQMAAVRQVLEEVGAIDVPLIEVYNKCDPLTPDERRRLQEQEPGALVHFGRAAGGHSRAGGYPRVASRAGRPPRHADRSIPTIPPIAKGLPACTRHARVLVHETRDGQVSIVADVPRRLPRAAWLALSGANGAARRCKLFWMRKAVPVAWHSS